MIFVTKTTILCDKNDSLQPKKDGKSINRSCHPFINNYHYCPKKFSREVS